MKYAIIRDGKVVNVALADQSFAEQQGWVQCPDNVSTDWLYDGTTFFEDPALIAEREERKAQAVRNERNKLLAECDWIVIMHTEKGTNIPAAWEAYRQSLRDITSHINFPYLTDADWPVKP